MSARKLPAKPDNELFVLVVSPFEGDLQSLKVTVRPSDWTLYTVGGWAEAMRVLDRSPVPVVLCESELPDGNWKDLLRAAAVVPNPPVMIVTSRLADERLWAEVLNLGGYDVLATPFDASEITRVISSAWRHWKDIHGAAADAQSA
jgi:DNA-binding response OmpR family regulator